MNEVSVEEAWWLRVRRKSEQRRRDELSSRRVIDMAIGVLMGLRGCSERDAFDDLANAVHETGLGLGALARALVDLVGNAEDAEHHAEAMHMWGYLLIGRLSPANTGS
ncbi:ANTAR domain-containing protein [Mycolicibacterium komossense]|uniref:ANTAR domain-containing protein n=1 Tax=Mycolicibacterium komossense TaxID=1779 RepID=A0ABT3CHT8_9MYCO|nr:ANTAR domain-containing protein [Mycolicibacterium komossense]MCV7228942.1 ANTAR domain-containing protein [Mycolicibacterium komossense]